MIVHTLPQRSPEWLALRAGKLTSTGAKDLLAKIKSGEAAVRRDLRLRLVTERLTGQSQEDVFVNAAMQWGTDHEAEATAAYEAATGSLVWPVGFLEHDDLPAGCSPDGLIGTDGSVSIKCPKSATHLRYLRDGGEPPEHAAQNLHEFWISGRSWIDFASYDPRLPGALQLFVVRIARDEAAVRAYDQAARAFLTEVETELRALETLAHQSAQWQRALEARTG